MFLRLTLCLAMRACQLDVKTEFSNGGLNENAWVMSPQGLSDVKSCYYRLQRGSMGGNGHILHRTLSFVVTSLGLGFLRFPVHHVFFGESMARPTSSTC